LLLLSAITGAKFLFDSEVVVEPGALFVELEDPGEGFHVSVDREALFFHFLFGTEDLGALATELSALSFSSSL